MANITSGFAWAVLQARAWAWSWQREGSAYMLHTPHGHIYCEDADRFTQAVQSEYIWRQNFPARVER